MYTWQFEHSHVASGHVSRTMRSASSQFASASTKRPPMKSQKPDIHLLRASACGCPLSLARSRALVSPG
jgi:hypothetical protein